MSPYVEVDLEDGVQVIRMNRPGKKNALDLEMYTTMAETVEAGKNNADVAVILFLGSDGAFTAGNDIENLQDLAQRGTFGKPILRFLRSLVQSEKPLVAAVDGPAIGIGTTMLFHFDLVYASESAHFRTPFLDLGLIPEAGSTLLGPRLLGRACAFELLVLGTTFDADRAEESGLVNMVVPASKLEATARSAALALSRKPPAALKAARTLLRGEAGEILSRLDKESGIFRDRITSPESREAFAAFLEKRAPRFVRS